MLNLSPICLKILATSSINKHYKNLTRYQATGSITSLPSSFDAGRVSSINPA